MQGVDNTWLSDNTAANLTSAGIGNWNQFDANRDKFGVNSSYDENLYTKKLDKSSITKSQIQKAEKLARAIESKSLSLFIIIFIFIYFDVDTIMYHF